MSRQSPFPRFPFSTDIQYLLYGVLRTKLPIALDARLVCLNAQQVRSRSSRGKSQSVRMPASIAVIAAPTQTEAVWLQSHYM